MLTYADLPSQARRALAAFAPAFVPWTLEELPARVHDATLPENEVAVVIRGALRDSINIDFAVSGHDQNDQLVVALLRNPDGTYRAMEIVGRSEEAAICCVAWPDSLARKIVVSLYSGRQVGISALGANGSLRGHARMNLGTGLFAWHSEIQRFRMWEPSD